MLAVVITAALCGLFWWRTSYVAWNRGYAAGYKLGAGYESKLAQLNLDERKRQIDALFEEYQLRYERARQQTLDEIHRLKADALHTANTTTH